MMDKIARISEAEIKTRLKNQKFNNLYEITGDYSLPIDSKLLTPAAVLVPMLWEADGWHLLFTIRNTDLPEHSGQVSFPGGRADLQDKNVVDTALREASEEIGLNPLDVVVLGSLPEFHTITNYKVTPVVGFIPTPYQFKIAPDEVSRVFSIPLRWLADHHNYNIHYRELPDIPEPVSVIYFKEYDGEILWGVSARIVVSFITHLSAG